MIARAWEVGPRRRSGEAGEQGRATGGGAKAGAKGNEGQERALRTQRRNGASQSLDRVRPAVSHPRREPNAGCERKAHCGNAARWDLWGRKPAMAELPDKAARTVLREGRPKGLPYPYQMNSLHVDGAPYPRSRI